MVGGVGRVVNERLLERYLRLVKQIGLIRFSLILGTKNFSVIGG